MSELMMIDPSDIWAPGKEPARVTARSLLCYLAVRELGISLYELSRRFNLSPSGVSLSVKRSETAAKSERFNLFLFKLETKGRTLNTRQNEAALRCEDKALHQRRWHVADEPGDARLG